MVSEKRAWKHDFLRALGRAFVYGTGPKDQVSAMIDSLWGER